MKFEPSGYEGHSGKITAVLLTLAALFWYTATGGYILVSRALYTLAVIVAAPLLANDLSALWSWIRD
jgi:hypothetical protein